MRLRVGAAGIRIQAVDNYERPCTLLTLASLVLTTTAVFPGTVVAPE